MVAKGLRAQLQTGNLLSGQRFIGLDFFPNASAGQINWQAAIPELPTQPGVLDSLQQQLEKDRQGPAGAR
jgi:paraquat-inducible protein B